MCKWQPRAGGVNEEPILFHIDAGLMVEEDRPTPPPKAALESTSIGRNRTRYAILSFT
jgi:hypothetical protein